MYVIARHEGEAISMLDGIIKIQVLSITGKIVRLGIQAPKEVDIHRIETVYPESKKMNGELHNE